jgi:hypothetical protein
MNDEQHNRYIAWAFVAHGAFQTLMGLLIAAIFLLLAIFPNEDASMPFLAVIGVFAFLIQIMFAAPGFVAAYGMFKKKSWARIGAIVAGVVSAMNVPIGTAACVYALWFFLGDNWKSVYEAKAPSMPAGLKSGDEARWDPYVKNDQGEVVFRHIDPPDWR